MTGLSKDRDFYRRFAGLGLALVFEQVAILSVNLLDNVMIGSYSEISLSAIAAVNQIQFFFQNLIVGVSGGMLALCSQYRGSAQTEPMKRVMASAMWLGLLFAAVLFATVCWTPEGLMRLFVDEEPAVVAEGVRYLRIIRYTYFLFAVTNVLLGCMRTVESVRISICVSCVALAVNFCLNYTLIFGHFGAPELGVTGSAIGTLAARAVEFLIVVFYVFRVDGRLCLRMGDFFRVEAGLTGDYLRISLPILVVHGLWGLNNAVQSGILGNMHYSVMAAYSISTVLFQLLKVAAVGASTAATILIGQCVGSGDPERLREYTRTLQVLFAGVGIVLGLLYFLMRIPLLSFYTLAEETREMANHFLLVQCVVIVGMSYQMPVLGGILRGGGSSRYQMIIDLVSIWGIVLPLSWCGAFLWDWSPLAVVICLNADQIFKCVPAFLLCNRYRWVRRLVSK